MTRKITFVVILVLCMGVSGSLWAASSPSIEELKSAAEAGHAKSQYTLGVRYTAGKDVPKDYDMARQWFEKAAAQNYAKAQFNLGLMYIRGDGVEQNEAIAKDWFKRACDNGDEKGCDAYNKFNN